MTLLKRILAAKRREVEERKRNRPLEALQEAARDAPEPRRFAAALARTVEGYAIIAEIKKASPSRGVIREDFDPVAIARAYEAGGATAISVLTDSEHFQGSLDHLSAVRREVGIPVLRKDFIIDPYQLWEARGAGADAVLLIVGALTDEELRLLGDEAEALGMDVLWEVHTLKELQRLAPLSPRLVGINNRDLRSFKVDLKTTERLAPKVPAGALTVSESGFSTREELEHLADLGVDAFLIGESLMRAPDPGAALAELLPTGSSC